jgi:hypothetical protein
LETDNGGQTPTALNRVYLLSFGTTSKGRLVFCLFATYFSKQQKESAGGYEELPAFLY